MSLYTNIIRKIYCGERKKNMGINTGAILFQMTHRNEIRKDGSTYTAFCVVHSENTNGGREGSVEHVARTLVQKTDKSHNYYEITDINMTQS